MRSRGGRIAVFACIRIACRGSGRRRRGHLTKLLGCCSECRCGFDRHVGNGNPQASHHQLRRPLRSAPEAASQFRHAVRSDCRRLRRTRRAVQLRLLRHQRSGQYRFAVRACGATRRALRARRRHAGTAIAAAFARAPAIAGRSGRRLSDHRSRVLPAATAPGVSAPAALGVPLSVVEAMVQRVRASGKLRVADIAEYNPSLDQDKRAARAAARLAYRLLERTSHGMANGSAPTVACRAIRMYRSRR